MIAQLEVSRLLIDSLETYGTRLAASEADVRAAQALHFQVFNLELNEGLEESVSTGLDADQFDAVCDHLLVEHLPSGEIVGTYRMQTGGSAKINRGYYSEQEFEFHPFETLRSEIIKLGRACVHRQHRNSIVLGALWKEIADYAQQRDARYLLGWASRPEQAWPRRRGR